MRFKLTHRLSMLIMFTTLCLASNYALIGLPQIKLMDFIVFTGGFLLGSVYGAAIGMLSWMVYGTINPCGFVPQIWLATMFSESIYGILGGIISRRFFKDNNFNDTYPSLRIFFGVLGFISTFLYDLITNVAYATAYGIPILVAIFVGAPYTILHQVCNATIFGVGFIPTAMALQKLMGGMWAGVLEK